MFVRLLVLLLAAMNIGVAMWWWWQPPPPPPVVVTAVGDVPTLRLVAEREPVPDTVAAAEAVGPPQPEEARDAHLCVEIGPFLTQVDLRRAVHALTPVAERIQYRDTRSTIRRGFRVFIPSPGSREAALATARELTAQGQRDYYVVTAGAEQNTISLGLYRDENNARRRHQEISALGFDVRTAPRDEEVVQYWVDLELAGDIDWRRALGGHSGTGSREIPCR